MTMIELVVSIALLATLLSVTVSLSILGDKIFRDGTDQASAQRNTSTVTEYVVSQIRNARSFVLLPNATVFSTPGYKGMKVTANIFQGFTIGVPGTAPNINKISDIKFYVYDQAGQSMFHLQITGTMGINQYVVDKEILLNNLTSSDIKATLTLSQWYSLTANTLYYKP